MASEAFCPQLGDVGGGLCCHAHSFLFFTHRRLIKLSVVGCWESGFNLGKKVNCPDPVWDAAVYVYKGMNHLLKKA